MGIINIGSDFSDDIGSKYNIDNNTFFRTVKSTSADRIKLEIGDSKQTDFYPQAKISRWDNEVNLSIRRLGSETSPVLITEGSKFIYQDIEEDVIFYERPEVSKDGGLEIGSICNW